MTSTVLLNWIWQGAVVALATTLVLRATPFLPARLRYRALWVSLLAVAALPGVAWLWTTAPAGRVGQPVVVEVEPVVATSWGMWIPVAFAVSWGLWTAVSSVRLVRALGRLRAARAAATAFPAHREARLRHWCAAGAGRVPDSPPPRRPGAARRATLVVSPSVAAAAVLGGRRPLIAVAPSLLDALTDDELDRVVMHEHAHVQRRDDLAVVAHAVMHAFVGWHPGVWWLGRALRVEREIACDELAIAATGEAKAYARCLTRLAALRAGGRSGLALVAVGSTSGLRRRVVRLLARPAAVSRYAHWYACAAILASSALALGVGRVSVVEVARSAADPARIALPAAMDLRLTALVPPAVAAPRPRDARTGARDADGSGSDRGAPPRSLTPDRSEAAGLVSLSDRAPAARVASAAGEPSPAPAEAEEDLRGAPAANQVGNAAGVAAARQDSPAPAVSSASDVPVQTPAASGELVLPSAPVAPATPWGVAADGGAAIGRASQKAAAATAGFFNRFGKRLAGAF